MSGELGRGISVDCLRRGREVSEKEYEGALRLLSGPDDINWQRRRDLVRVIVAEKDTEIARLNAFIDSQGDQRGEIMALLREASDALAEVKREVKRRTVDHP